MCLVAMLRCILSWALLLYTFWSNHGELQKSILKIWEYIACNLTTEELTQTNFFCFFLFFLLKFLERLVPRTFLNDCFCAFLPFCAVFKKFRNIVSEKLHPCPHVLEYPHRLLSFSNISPKFYARWIEFCGDEIWWDS